MLLRNLLTQALPANVTEVEVERVVDDTRVLQRGDWLVWDEKVKPGISDGLFAQAREKGAAGIISNADGADVCVEEPGDVLARWAANHWPRQPRVMLGVTGTSGKTSVAWFGQQLAAAAGVNAASVGTLGVVRNSEVLEYTGYTSPSALQLHPRLQALAEDGVDTCVMEVSSHAAALRRADGVRWEAMGWGNFDRDHLDFHGSVEAYFEAKMRLFDTVLPEGKTAVLNTNHSELWPVAAVAKQRGCPVLSVGTHTAELVVEVVEAEARGLMVKLKYTDVPELVRLPLVGSFQAENVALALGLLVAGGLPWEKLTAAASRLTGVPGRMEVVPGKETQPVVVVDYAHKPDALKKALEALRPQTRGRLWVVFGCGGNRDAGKRPVMGKIAADLADRVVVTDDNPRFENAGLIRQAVVAGAGGAKHVQNVADRREAIALAIQNAAVEDVILVAGKGHEDGQIVGEVVLPFDDRSVVREILG